MSEAKRIPEGWRGLPVGLAAVLACWLAHQVPEPWPIGLCQWLLVLVLGLLASVQRVGSRWPVLKRWHGPLLLISVSSAFFLTTQWRAQLALADRIDAADEGRTLSVEGYVDELPVRFEHGIGFGFRVQHCLTAAQSCRPGQLLRLSTYGARGRSQTGQGFEPRPGERWRLEVRLKRVHAILNPGGFDSELRALEDGIAARGYVRSADRAEQPRLGWFEQLAAPMVAVHSLRFELRERMQLALRGAEREAAAVMVALVMGDQSGIRPASWERFNRTGIGHLISISGLHITLLAAIAHGLVHRLWSARWPLRWFSIVLPTLLPTPIAARLCAIATGFAYSALAGWGIPAQRTCWMLAFALLANLGNRGGAALNVLAGALVVVLALDPWAVLAPGFWLSFAAVAAIVWFGQTARAAAPQASRWAGLLAAARAQWAVSLALIPLGAVFFNSVSLISPLANTLAIPIVSFVVTPLALAGAAGLFFVPMLGTWGLRLGASIFEFLMMPLRGLDGVAWAVHIVPAPDSAVLLISLAGLVLGLSRVVPARGWALLVLTPLLFRPADRPRQDGEFWVQVLDVGQGTAVLVETRDGRLLFDTGPKLGVDSDAGQRTVAPYLRWRGIERLEVLAISHRDDDHSGGAPGVLRAVQVAQVSSSLEDDDPIRTQVAERGITHVACRRGERWEWSGVRFEWLHPGVERSRSSRSTTNANSCVLRVSSSTGSLLLTGDIEAAQERELLSALDPTELRSHALVVPHHGSRTSSSAEFLAAVQPDVAIFQLGYRNRYRHPHPRVWERYQHSVGRLLRSDYDGAIELKFRPDHAVQTGRLRADRPPYWRICADPAVCKAAL